MHKRKTPIHINESFTCDHCGAENPPRDTGCRNHCRDCLYSFHVDAETPGDRLSDCHSLMKPIGLEYSGKKGYMIIHQCERCEKQIRNMTADDDNYDLIVELSSKPKRK